MEVFYQFKNEEKGGLGMPMPAGTVRVYQSDSNGGVQFVGEDRIAHTPKDEVLNLKIGNAFDVVCERNQVDFEKIGPNVYEVEYAITLRNRKSTPITVEVNEPVGAATWRMLHASHKWTKTAAFAAQFIVPVEAGAETGVEVSDSGERVRRGLQESRRPGEIKRVLLCSFALLISMSVAQCLTLVRCSRSKSRPKSPLKSRHTECT